MAVSWDGLKKAGKSAASWLDKNVGGDLRGVGTSIADAIVAREFQGDFAKRQSRSLELDNMLNASAKKARLSGDSAKARKLTGLTGNFQTLQGAMGRELTSPEDARRSFAQLAGTAAMGFAPGAKAAGVAAGRLASPSAVRAASEIPRLAAAPPIQRLLGYGAVRGAENALPGAVVNAASGMDHRQVLKQAAGDFAGGALLNAAFSPRLAKAAGDEGVETYRVSKRLSKEVRPFLDRQVPTGNTIMTNLPSAAGGRAVPVRNYSAQNSVEVDGQDFFDAAVGGNGARYVKAKDGTMEAFQNPQTGGTMAVRINNPFLEKQVRGLSGDPRAAKVELDTVTGGLAGKIEDARNSAQAANIARKAGSGSPVQTAPPKPGSFKDRSFTEGARTSPDFSEEMRGSLPNDTYDVRSTAKLSERAKAAVDESPDAVVGRLRRDGINSDEDLAQAIEAAKRLDSEGRFDDAVELTLSASESLTKAGQFVQAASLLNRMSESGAVAWATTAAKAAGKELKPEKKAAIQALAKKLSSAKEALEAAKSSGADPKTLAKLERAANLAAQKVGEGVKSVSPSSVLDQALDVWRAGLLTGLKTTGVNVTANAANQGLRRIAAIPATLADMAIAPFTGQRTRTLTQKGTLSGIKEGAKEAADYLVSGYDPRQVGSKFDGGTVFSDNPVGKAAQAYAESVYRFIGAQDRPFYYGALRNSLEDQAGAAAINAGKRGDKRFLGEFVSSPPRAAIERATEEAKAAVFQQDTLLGKASGAVQKVPGAKAILPFASTPSAVISEVFSYTPAGPVYEIGKMLQQGKFDQRKFTETLGKVTVGTGAIWLGTELAKAGAINTGYPASEQERELWKAEGRQENSIVMPDGTQWSAQALGPAGNLIVAGAAVQKAVEEGGDPASVLAAQVGNVALESPALQGVSGLADALKDPVNKGKAFANSTGASVVPTVVADAAQALDRAPNGEGVVRESGSFKDAFKNRVPGLREQQPQAVDSLGQPRTTGKDAFQTVASPVRSRTLNVTDVTSELSRLAAAGEKTGLSKADKTLKANGQTLKLSADDQRFLASEGGARARKDLEALFGSEYYRSSSDESKAKAASSIFESARRGAKAALLSGSGTSVASVSSPPGAKSMDMFLAKERVATGQSQKEQVGDVVFVPDGKGGVRTVDLKESRQSARTKALDQTIQDAKRSKDWTEFDRASKEKYGILRAKLSGLDPELDAAEIAGIEASVEDLLYSVASARRTASKPKKGTRGARVSVGSLPSVSVRGSSSGASAGTFKAPKVVPRKVRNYFS